MVHRSTKTIQSDGDYYDVLINVAKKKNGEFVYDVTVRENKKRISPSAAYKNVPTLQGRKFSVRDRMVLWVCMFQFRCCFASRYKHVDVKARLKLSVLHTFS